MKRIILTLASVLMLAGVVCAQFTANGTQVWSGNLTSPAPSTSVQPAVLPSLFSIHVHSPSLTWPSVPIGGVRLWGTSTYWNILSPSTGAPPNCTGSDGSYTWTNLDSQIAIADANNTNLIYTVVGINPCWTATNQSVTCAAGGVGVCSPPNDVAADGTGTDNHLIQFISAFMAHIQGGADPHHRIIGFECSNEPNGPVSNPTGPTGYWTGTIPQLARMCKDIYQTVKAADATMIVTSPAPSKGINGPSSWLPLYFADPSNPIQYADVIAFHNYNNQIGIIPKASDNLIFLSNIATALAPLHLTSKPFWVTEGSWDESGVTPLTNPDQKGGYIIQDYVLLNSLGVQRFYFFAWDQNGGEGYITSGVIQPAGIAAGQVYDWMVGAMPATVPACVLDTNSTFTCTYTRSGGYTMQIIWNQVKDPTDTCTPTGGAGGQVFTIPVGYTRYRDMYGNAHAVTPGQTLNACFDPIALETGVPPVIQVSTGTILPGAVKGVAYNFTATVTGSSSAPFRWQVRQGSSVLPAGIALNQNTGKFSGTATVTGSFPFQLSACDANGFCDALNVTLNVAAAPSSADNTYCAPGNVQLYPGPDGYAQAPSRCVNSARASTPNSGSVVAIHTAAAFTAQLNTGLTCGTIYMLDAGVTYSFPSIQTFKATGCDDTHWIWLESTGVSNPSWPAEGTRITPCLGSLQAIPAGRPGSCPAIAPLTAVLNYTGVAGTFLDMGTNSPDHIRFVGIEIARAPNSGTNGQTVGPMIAMGGGTTSFPNKIIFDQTICHGVEGIFPMTASGGTNPYSETTRCMGLGQSNTIAVVESYWYNFYCTSGVGTGCDSQALSGGIGTVSNTGWGNYKIVNNHLEGAAETMEWGGGLGPGANPCQPSCVDDSPKDFEVRLNHMFKPLQWMPPTPTTAIFGYPVVKNIYEHKNGEFIWFEGNVLENVWAGFSQAGISFVLGPKSQSAGATGNQCPNCSIHDGIFRYNLTKNSCQPLQLANGTNDNGVPAFQGFGYSFHDNLFDNTLNANAFKCGGGSPQEFQVSEWTGMNITSDILHNASVNHNTVVVASPAIGQPSGMMGLSGAQFGTGFDSNNILITNNLVTQGVSGTINVIGAHQAINCAYDNNGGAVNTNGTIVTWVSGLQFGLGWAGSTIAIGLTATSGGVTYTIASVQSTTQLTLTSTAGTQTASNYAFGVVGAGAAMITSCFNAFPPSSFIGNAIVGSTSIWPTGQCLGQTYSSIFVNYNNGSGGDYHVPLASPCHLFSDGGTTDPGANIDLVNLAVSGVVESSLNTALLSNNNTSACLNGTAGCLTAFAGLSTNPGNTAAQTQVVAPVPGAVSSVKISNYLYTGATTQIDCAYQPWFLNSGTFNGHVNIGMDESNPTNVAKQAAAMVARGCNSINIDWYGTDASQAFILSVTNAWATYLAGNPSVPLKMGIMLDQGALIPFCATATADQTSCLTTAMEAQLDYIDANYGSKSFYALDSSARPLLWYFITPKTWHDCVDFAPPCTNFTTIYTAVQTYAHAHYVGRAYQILDEFGSITEAGTDGTYGWPQPSVFVNGSPNTQCAWDDSVGNNSCNFATGIGGGTSYLQTLYTACKANPTKHCSGMLYKGFDDTNASWGSNRIRQEGCGQVPVLGAGKINSNFSTTTQLERVIWSTWNDYEEGTEIETGIDNCARPTVSVATNTLTYVVNPTDATFYSNTTVDHLAIYYGPNDGSGSLTLALDNISPSTTSQSLSAIIPTGTWNVYEYMVGKSGILNRLAGPAVYTH